MDANDQSSSPHYSQHSDSGLKHTSKRAIMPQQLLTPEGQLMDDFDSNVSLPSIRSTIEPSTPNSTILPSFPKAPGADASPQDELLYPDHNAAEATGSPLFGRSGSIQSGSSSSSFGQLTNAPTSSQSPSTFRSVVQQYQASPMDYWRERDAELNAMREAHRRSRQLPPVQGSRLQRRDSFSRQQLSRLNASNSNVSRRPERALESRAAPTPRSRPSLTATASPTGISKRRPRQSGSRGARTVTPEAKPRTRAPATKKKEGPNPDGWFEVESFCPPVNSLDASRSNLVTAELLKTSASNAGRTFDLANDADRKHLHPQELELALALRLPCNMYLLCKRRIFAAKVQALKDGKEFNKTAAQNVCTIDVNKVSRLWTAFNGVGWFEEHWFDQYM